MIACPKGTKTGGPEALHQLAQMLRKFHPATYLWDPNPENFDNTPAEEYSAYGDLWVSSQPENGDVIVLPEIMSELICNFYESNTICFWWLSVDNFIQTSQVPVEIIRDLYPQVIHLYQSEYANQYLLKNNISKKLALSDYINLDFFKTTNQIQNKFQVNDCAAFRVAINPKKGFERASKIIDKIDAEAVVLLEAMSRSDLIDRLKTVHFYIDLGNHPGKDRIPREAALLNCIVLTNLRGSAANEIDVPIDKKLFKFDDDLENFETKILSSLNEMSKNFEEFLTKQTPYKELIINQRNIFKSEVKALYEYLQISKKDWLIDESNYLRKYIYFLITSKNEAIVQNIKLRKEKDELAFDLASVTDLFEKQKTEMVKLIEAKSLYEEKFLSINMTLASIRGSFSWKITKPIRLITNILRKNFR